MKKNDQLLSLLHVAYPDSVINFDTDSTHSIISVLPKDNIDIISFLKSKTELSFKTLIDITAVDYPDRKKRFDIVYHFLSMTENRRCRVICSIEDGDVVKSITSIFSCANWFEREIFDLYGIKFSSHPDLRRILTDYGFEGHPLRKDFPTTGFLEVRYDEEQKKVIYEPTSLVQEFRSMDFTSPWENPDAFKIENLSEDNS
jgi:NADH-quinone oxidoreductase subunit C